MNNLIKKFPNWLTALVCLLIGLLGCGRYLHVDNMDASFEDRAITSQDASPSEWKHKEGLVPSSMAQVSLLKEGNQIDPHLLDFLKLFGLEHDGTIESVDRVMQANFIRGATLERRDLIDANQEQSLRPQALALLSKLGMVEEIPHSVVSADYGLIFGAMIGAMKSRLKDFVTQYDEKTLQCRNIVLLGGVRPLRSHEIAEMEHTLSPESFQEFMNKVGKGNKADLTEADLFRFAWEQEASNDLKENCREGYNLFFINSTTTTDCANNRPTTKNTIEAWLETCHPEPGSCHANVEKPYGVRMEKVLRKILQDLPPSSGTSGKSFSITWNSPAAKHDLQIAVYKDELARTFHAECLLKGLL